MDTEKDSWFIVQPNLTISASNRRPVVPGGAMAPPDFGRSVNPILTMGDRLYPPNYYWYPQIFRPSDGPER